MTRKSETRLVYEWAQVNVPGQLQWRNERLGPLPNNEYAKLYKVTQRYADLIYLKDSVIHILEAKIRPSPNAAGQLELYEQLFRDTPSFHAFRNHAIQLQFLTTYEDPLMKTFYEGKGIDYIVYAPVWAKEE